jgi:dTDP-4-dehydrorhamnose 3,5-epimerase
MYTESTAIPDVKVMTPEKHHDARGFFSEVYNAGALARHGINIGFVQDNYSHSTRIGTVRGLHFQAPPFAQTKLIRVTRGRILDVAVDIRRGSPTFGRHVAIELSAENWRQLLVPVGFAHGICTLEPDTEITFKVSSPHSSAHDLGLAWDDPDLGITWPLAGLPVLSNRDRRNPRLKDLDTPF